MFSWPGNLVSGIANVPCISPFADVTNALPAVTDDAPSLEKVVDAGVTKELTSVPILEVNLPKTVYMIVDKKVELNLQAISDLPEWSFLPENELKRTAILLFSNQRTAKRICSRNQRVIKIPNTRIFKLSKSYLIAKGITRLILEDSIIGLDY